MRHDLHNSITVAKNISIATLGASSVGTIIDLQNVNALEYVISSGTITTGTFTPLLEHGNDSSLTDAAAVPANQLLGTYAGATFTGSGDSNKAKNLGYIPTVFRYVRLTLVGTATPVGVLGANSIKTSLAFSPPA